MKWAVMLFVSGRVFTEVVIAKNEVEARATAQARQGTHLPDLSH